ncbi:MAG: glucokinase [Nitrospiria bacterium]
MILAGDIGGTKTDLGLFQMKGKKLTLIRRETFPSGQFKSLDEVIQQFLRREDGTAHSACFGVAGPVIDGKCKTTNLPWIVDAKTLGKRFGIPSVTLLNDLEAMAYGTLWLNPRERYPLNPGKPQLKGNRCVIAAGTGLGEAILFWNGSEYKTSATEGGHADFAPRNETEIRLLEYMLKRHTRVSYERILSGPGLFNIYQFLRESGQYKELSQISKSIEKNDPSAVISEMALKGKSELCVKSLELFISIYGAEAGNLALKVMATGGVYIGGSIGIKLLRKLKEGSFMKSFENKGRMALLMNQMPVHVILNKTAPLLGAAHFSAHFLLSKAI